MIPHVLGATSLVWAVTLAHHLVHLGNVINAEASGTLIVALKFRRLHVVLLGLTSCRAFPWLLGQLTEHPA